MKLSILGASGGCGVQLVTQAVARGHTVKAVVRSSSYQAPPGVEVIRGDLTDAGFLTRAIQGADAVISALGLRMPGIAPLARPEVPDFLTRATPALVAAMKEAGVRRLLAISAGGVGDSEATASCVEKPRSDFLQAPRGSKSPSPLEWSVQDPATQSVDSKRSGEGLRA